VKLVIAGAGGRMGRVLIEMVLRSADLELAGALEISGSPLVGTDAGALVGLPGSVRISSGFAQGDCLIDFTRPEGALANLDQCVAKGMPAVIGTTGFSGPQQRRIAGAAERIAIVQAPNMSAGVNLAITLAERAARALGEGYDVEIIEAHHRHKVDAPSGTALAFGAAVAGALGRDVARDAVHGRKGEVGERKPGSIGFHAIRGGDIVGEHTVMFAGEGERLEITVRSSTRATYATGALRAARFLKGRASGLYDMRDVLGLRER
jgi:4-hydroxy-tetrahydrodipicolinate reductase